MLYYFCAFVMKMKASIFQDYISEWNVPPGETEDVEHSWVDYKVRCAFSKKSVF